MNLVPLSQICRIVNGGTPKSGVAGFWGGNVAWLTPAEMGKLDAPQIGATVRMITEAGLKNSSAKQVPVRSVILSTRAPIGHLAIPLVPMAFNQGCRGLMPSEKLDTKYLYYFLWFSREALNDLGTGTTFKELSSGALGAYKIPLAPLEEQRRIVAVLDEAFVAIGIATANAEKNIMNARDVFDEELRAIFEVSASGARRRLGDLLPLITDGTHNSPSYVESGIPMLDTKNIGDDFSIDEAAATKFIAPATDEALSKRCKPRVDDILISSRGTIGRIAIVGNGQNFNIMGNIILIRPSDELRPQYLAWFLHSEVSKLQALSRGTAQKGLYLNQIRTYEIPVPSQSEQERMVQTVSEIRQSTRKFEEIQRRKLMLLADLKRAMLTDLFEGGLTEQKSLAA